jgi:hypothetical protein
MSALSVKQKEAIVGLRVEGTHRSSDRPPLVAPYNFGIDEGWWEECAEDYPNHIADYFTHTVLDPDVKHFFCPYEILKISSSACA